MQTFGQLLGALILEARESAGLGQRELAEESFPESSVDLKQQRADSYESFLDGKERRVRELESGQITRPQARVYAPICETLNIDRATIRDLKRQAADAKAQADAEFAEVIEDEGSVDAALSDTAALTRDQLEALADRFGIENAASQTDTNLREVLAKKADEYRALKAEVEAIDDGLKRLSNLKAAARDAIDRGDLDEVEAMLQRVQEVELDEAAKTAELRARNALLRGRVDQAYTLLSAAADSFAAVDPLEPARRRLYVYARILWERALRYGGEGFRQTLSMVEPIRTNPPKGIPDKFRADAIIWQAIALQHQGTRTGGPEGAALLAEAVTAYRDALTVYTRDDHPVDWAMTQNNLAIALSEQGIHTGGPEGTALLAEAVTAYRDALTVYTRDDQPVHWAMTQNNLANALLEQGIHTGGPEGAALLAEAVTASRDALTVYTRDDHPVDWARTQNNLGNALQEQGIRSAGPQGAALLAEAVTAYRAAQTARTRDDHPVHWAETQQNTAIAEQAIAKHDATPDPAPHLTAALEHVEAALQVFDPEHMPYDHTKATALRDEITQALADL